MYTEACLLYFLHRICPQVLLAGMFQFTDEAHQSHSLWTLVELCWKTIWEQLPKWKCICSSILRNLLFGNTFVIKEIEGCLNITCKKTWKLQNVCRREWWDILNRILCDSLKKEILHKLSLKKHVLEQSLYFILIQMMFRKTTYPIRCCLGWESGSDRPGSREERG